MLRRRRYSLRWIPCSSLRYCICFQFSSRAPRGEACTACVVYTSSVDQRISEQLRMCPPIIVRDPGNGTRHSSLRNKQRFTLSPPATLLVTRKKLHFIFLLHLTAFQDIGHAVKFALDELPSCCVYVQHSLKSTLENALIPPKMCFGFINRCASRDESSRFELVKACRCRCYNGPT